MRDKANSATKSSAISSAEEKVKSEPEPTFKVRPDIYSKTKGFPRNLPCDYRHYNGPLATYIMNLYILKIVFKGEVTIALDQEYLCSVG